MAGSRCEPAFAQDDQLLAALVFGGVGLPLLEKGGDGGWVHVAHVLKLAGFLAVEEAAVGIENSESGDAALEGNVILGGEIGVVVVVADVDVDEDVAGVEECVVGLLMKVEIEDLAVAAPVTAEVEDDALMLARGDSKGVADFSMGVGGFVVDVAGVELLLGEGRGNGESDEENKGGSRVFSDHSYQVQIRLGGWGSRGYKDATGGAEGAVL